MPKAKKKPKKMPKQEFIRLLSRRLDISQEATSLVIDTVQGVILESLEDYDSVKFGDLVVFNKHNKPEATRILNGERVTSPPYTGLKATITERFKKMN